MTAMIHALKKRIEEQRDAVPRKEEFCDQLVQMVSFIEHHFEGSERENLIKLASETLDRHIQLGENTAKLQSALERIRSHQQRLHQLTDFLKADTEPKIIH